MARQMFEMDERSETDKVIRLLDLCIKLSIWIPIVLGVMVLIAIIGSTIHPGSFVGFSSLLIPIILPVLVANVGLRCTRAALIHQQATERMTVHIANMMQQRDSQNWDRHRE